MTFITPASAVDIAREGSAPMVARIRAARRAISGSREMASEAPGDLASPSILNRLLRMIDILEQDIAQINRRLASQL